MGLTGERTFVGFGFGAIQAGLFLFEAYRSGNFRRLVVAEVRPELVNAVRGASGRYAVNVAHADHIETVLVGPVEIENPATEAGREGLIEAVAGADEIATAVPNIHDYVSDSPGSVHRLLAAGLRRTVARAGRRAVLYAAENHNRAAEILEKAVMAVIPAGEQSTVSSRIRFLNTVIGKMSGVVPTSGAEDVSPIAPGIDSAFLVEAFNRILISEIRFGKSPETLPFSRGITCFLEKHDLLPFEEAKLYGHNATHALAACLGAVRGVKWMAHLRELPEIMNLVKAAFVEESGTTLIRRHAGVDPLFTPKGYREYAEDLLARMVNTYLQDSVERVSRDPARKLAWDDRLVGTMRVALGAGVTPRRYALGAAAALATMDPSVLSEQKSPAFWLEPLWGESVPDSEEKHAVLELIDEGRAELRRWIRSGCNEFHEFA